uniref:Uncharacterized protein n=1 Tax=Glossina pallidipes TaxID=7398 RepID=A0A1A9ZDU3_GLOPL
MIKSPANAQYSCCVYMVWKVSCELFRLKRTGDASINGSCGLSVCVGAHIEHLIFCSTIEDCCPVCAKNVTVRRNGIDCVLCERVVHLGCAGVSEEQPSFYAKPRQKSRVLAAITVEMQAELNASLENCLINLEKKICGMALEHYTRGLKFIIKLKRFSWFKVLKLNTTFMHLLLESNYELRYRMQAMSMASKVLCDDLTAFEKIENFLSSNNCEFFSHDDDQISTAQIYNFLQLMTKVQFLDEKKLKTLLTLLLNSEDVILDENNFIGYKKIS